MATTQIPVVVAALFRRGSQNYEVFTQRRIVHSTAYDPLYDGTWEAVGETVKAGESVLDALIRGIQEECGDPEFTPRGIYGASGKAIRPTLTNTGKDDDTLTIEPMCFVQQLKRPQLWSGPAFGVEVSPRWEPDPRKKDGEAGEHRWWELHTLRRALEENTKPFMGLHVGALHRMCKILELGLLR